VTISANTSGEISGVFTIPDNIPQGTKIVEFVGAQGSRGTATFIGEGEISITQMQRTTTITTRRWDPLAQTFSLPDSKPIAGCKLWFKTIGTLAVIVQLREVSNGIPTQQVLANTLVEAADIQAVGTATQFEWSPVFLQADQEYALVVLTDDPDHALSIAQLGRFDVSSGWVTQQPYQIGVLLSSSNASTWTPHQDMDLTFQLLAAKFTETTKEYSFGTFDATDVSDLLTLATVERTSSNTDIVWIVRNTDGDVFRLQENQPLNLPSLLSGEYELLVEIRGDMNRSPVLHTGIQAVLGKIRPEADYISRAFKCGNATKITVTLNGYTQGLSTITVYYQDNGNWTLMTVINGEEIGDGWEELTYSTNDVSTPDTRIKLVLKGDATARPLATNLRAIVTDAE